jgi:hypothetical protein
MLSEFKLTPAKTPGELPAPGCLDTEFLDSPFLRWIALADTLLNKPREVPKSKDLSN